MERLLASIAKLDKWGVDNHVDLSNELKSIEAKIKSFYKKNGYKEKVVQVPRVKVKKNNQKTTVTKSVKASKPLTLHQLTTTINFEVSSKLVKGISHCHFCKVRRLECREHALLSGNKVLVCKDCRQRRHKQYLVKKKIYVDKDDALNYLVSGSYGSGKASR